MSALPLVWAPADPVAAGLNLVTAVGVSFAAGYWAHRLPSERLARDGPLLRLRTFERDGRIYADRLAIGRWKGHLPEAGAFFAGGTSKRRLVGADPVSLRAFAIETRRAERSHWVSLLLVSTVPLLWNGVLGSVLMILYGLVSNAPCIAVQRYNRARLVRVLDRHSGAAGTQRAQELRSRTSTPLSDDG
ncbi:hypothetical protein [Desertimonas flava]|jgi:glycosyl-4,4'-diaponeurosporenoate acyltransferase|uniref:glycosyl-4,4'-diaponeurosporenoate acyltransferase CrtO family protein n=1 Tax=Desertimonas flava TaxID=2064846 RepID=UPI0013C49BE0|nr:hypothetical protein [Desertimonas flava]